MQPLSNVFAPTPNASSNRFTQQIDRIRSPGAQTKLARRSPSPVKNASRKPIVLSPKPAGLGGASQDSGYFGSQDVHTQAVPNEDDDLFASQQTLADRDSQHITTASHNATSPVPNAESPVKRFGVLEEDQTTRALADAPGEVENPRHVDLATMADDAKDDMGDAMVHDHPRLRPADQAPASPDGDGAEDYYSARSADGPSDEVRSNSDGSSPIRPVVRKSSLNFASLPAREPLTAGKSQGARTSRISHFDHNTKSYYNRDTGGKSLGNHTRRDVSDENEDEMDIDEHSVAQTSDDKVNTALNHNKTYTQRLQDQINMLGKSKPRSSRPSKSIPSIATIQQNSGSSQLTEAPKSPTPKPFEAPKTTPGAFPEDDDDWIDPPPAPVSEEIRSPRPALPKSHSADVMEGIHRSDHVSDTEFGSPKETRGGNSSSPRRVPMAQGPSSAGMGHAKSASVPDVPIIPQQIETQTLPLTKAVTVSNPLMGAVGETAEPKTPSKSPSRGFRESPLKQVKNKLSSILKSSKGLLASSAVISAEGKTSILSPSTTRLGFHAAPSTESVVSKLSNDVAKLNYGQPGEKDDNRTLPIARRTRASVEREKEERRRAKESKRLEDQMGKLDKAREQEREKARVFSKEQERLASMERQVTTKKDEERLLVKETPKPVRNNSPRKIQRLPESTTKPVDHDVEMTEGPFTIPPPSASRSGAPSQASKSKEIKRPVKPNREIQAKAKQVPTVIRVNMGSQHSQYHSTANSSTSSAPDVAVEPTPPQQQQVPSKASKASLQTKPSTQNLKGAPGPGRPKAVDMAAKKREQEERDAQRRREAKAEMERKQAVAQEDRRKQDQRRQEAERQKQRDREQAAAHAEMKQSTQNAQRQAMIEKAKQTRAPPPAVRAQPNGPPDFSHISHDKPAGNSTRPLSRMESGIPKTYDDPSRPVNAPLSNTSKSGVKRTLGPEASEDAQGRPPPSRGGPAYPSNDVKRLRKTEDHGEMGLDNPPNIKGPPVRPSAGFKKVSIVVCESRSVFLSDIFVQEIPKKSHFQNGYSNAPSGTTRDLFKATVSSQLNSHGKGAHPLDMAQISKGAIPFAPNSNPPGTSHKTPSRPPTVLAKSSVKAAPKSSPRFQNGESIELPEIQTDDEDESEDEARGMIAAWADSPDLRKALIMQETIDPSQIFGPPAPLNMEEVFNKSRERWHKFRARTSSANWSGTDRLTEAEIRKDLAARDKLRRDGGWSFELSRDVS